MFIPWEKDVTGRLTPGMNELKIILRSPFKMGLKKYRELPYRLPANNDEHEFRVSPFTRKAPYMYGWDWGPRLLTSGIWKDVILVKKGAAGIESAADQAGFTVGGRGCPFRGCFAMVQESRPVQASGLDRPHGRRRPDHGPHP